jgi:helix-turn-helix protein
MALVELSIMEQRYEAVMAVLQDGWKITEVAERLEVSRQTIHNWIVRYEKQGGLPALANRSHRPKFGNPRLRTACWADAGHRPFPSARLNAVAHSSADSQTGMASCRLVTLMRVRTADVSGTTIASA